MSLRRRHVSTASKETDLNLRGMQQRRDEPTPCTMNRPKICSGPAKSTPEGFWLCDAHYGIVLAIWRGEVVMPKRLPRVAQDLQKRRVGAKRGEGYA